MPVYTSTSGTTTNFSDIDLSGGILIGDRDTVTSGPSTTYTHNQTSRIHHPTDISGLRIVPTMNNDLSDNHIDFTTGTAGDDGTVGMTFQVGGYDTQTIRTVENGDAFEITNNVADGVIRLKTRPESGGDSLDRLRIGDSVGRDLISSRYQPSDISSVSLGDLDVRFTVPDISGNVWVDTSTWFKGADMYGNLLDTSVIPVFGENEMVGTTTYDPGNGRPYSVAITGDSNRLEYDTNYRGVTTKVWKSLANDPAEDADGGLDIKFSDYYPATGDISYMMVTYFKVIYNSEDTDPDNGLVLVGPMGWLGNTQRFVGGEWVDEINPYFTVENARTYVSDEWYMSIGILYSENTSTPLDPSIAGVYRVSTGDRVSTPPTEFRLKSGASETTRKLGIRTYGFYDKHTTGTTDNQNPTKYLFSDWGIYEMNGMEPTKEQLLGNDIQPEIAATEYVQSSDIAGDICVEVIATENKAEFFRFIDTSSNSVIPVSRNIGADNKATATTTVLDSIGARPGITSDIGDNKVSQLFTSSFTGELTEILVNHDFLFTVSNVKIQKVVNGRTFSGDDKIIDTSTAGITVDGGIYTNGDTYYQSNTESTYNWDGTDAGLTDGSCKKIILSGTKPVLLRNAQYVITITGTGCTTGKDLVPTNMRVVNVSGGGYTEATVDGSWPKPYPMKFLVDSISITGENDDGNLFDISGGDIGNELEFKCDYAPPLGAPTLPANFTANFQRLGWTISIEKVAGTDDSYNMIATSPVKWGSSTETVVSGGGYVVARLTRGTDVVDGTDKITFGAIRMVNYGANPSEGFRVGTHTVVRGGWGFISEFQKNYPNTDWWLRKVRIEEFLHPNNAVNDGNPNIGQSHTVRLVGTENIISAKPQSLTGDEPNIAMYFDADATGNHIVCSVPRTFTYLPEMPQSYYFNMDEGGVSSKTIVTHGRVPPPIDTIHSMATIHGKVSIHSTADTIYIAIQRQVVKYHHANKSYNYVLGDDNNTRFESSVNVYRMITTEANASFEYLNSFVHADAGSSDIKSVVGTQLCFTGDTNDEVQLMVTSASVKGPLSDPDPIHPDATTFVIHGSYGKQDYILASNLVSTQYTESSEFNVVNADPNEPDPAPTEELFDVVFPSGNVKVTGDIWANKFHVTNPLEAQTVLSNEINAQTMTAGTLNVSNIVLDGKNMDVLDGTGVMGALNGIDVSFGAVDVNGPVNAASFTEDGIALSAKYAPLTDGAAGDDTLRPEYISFPADPNEDRIKFLDNTNYTIGIGNRQLGGLAGYAITFKAQNGVSNGFLWKNSAQMGITEGVMALTTQGKLTVASNTRIGYGKYDTVTPEAYMLDVNGSMAATTVTASGVVLTSDDRLKHNEVLLTQATVTLGKLKPQIYDKSREFDSRDNIVRESGLIAQDIWYDAPELRHLVNLASDVSGHPQPHPQPLPQGTDRSDPQNDPDYTGLGWGGKASVNYNGLIAYLIQANQELDGRLAQKSHDMDALKVEMAQTMTRMRVIEGAHEKERVEMARTVERVRVIEVAVAAEKISKNIPKELKPIDIPKPKPMNPTPFPAPTPAPTPAPAPAPTPAPTPTPTPTTPPKTD